MVRLTAIDQLKPINSDTQSTTVCPAVVDHINVSNSENGSTSKNRRHSRTVEFSEPIEFDQKSTSSIEQLTQDDLDNESTSSRRYPVFESWEPLDSLAEPAVEPNDSKKDNLTTARTAMLRSASLGTNEFERGMKRFVDNLKEGLVQEVRQMIVPPSQGPSDSDNAQGIVTHQPIMEGQSVRDQPIGRDRMRHSFSASFLLNKTKTA